MYSVTEFFLRTYTGVLMYIWAEARETYHGVDGHQMSLRSPNYPLGYAMIGDSVVYALVHVDRHSLIAIVFDDWMLSASSCIDVREKQFPIHCMSACSLSVWRCLCVYVCLILSFPLSLSLWLLLSAWLSLALDFLCRTMLAAKDSILEEWLLMTKTVYRFYT